MDVDQAIAKAGVLVEALPYIQRFRGEIVVVKFGGSIMDDVEGCRNIMRDIALMEAVGMRPVVVHGGGKAISRKVQEAGGTPRFVQGLRVTDELTIQVVERVLNHEVNSSLVEMLRDFDCRAAGIFGQHVTRARRHTRSDPETGELLDWGFVGEVESVETDALRALLKEDTVPVLTPLGQGADGHVYNINADEAASAVAKALQARKLVFLSDVPGVLRDPADRSTLMSSLTLPEVDQLIAEGVIAGGMLPKVSGALNALRAGIRKTHMIDAQLPHSLLLELFTDQGVGTEITHG